MVYARLIVAGLLLAGFFTLYFYAPFWLWRSVFIAVLCLGAWEWANLLKLSNKMAVVYCLCLGAAATLFPLTYIFLLWWMSVLFWALIAPWCLWQRPNLLKRPVGFLLGALILLPACLSIVWLREISPDILLTSLAAVCAADSGAFFAGRAWGRHKLLPAVSPGKTWEGALGGLLCGMLMGLVVWRFFHADWPVWLFPLLGGLIVISIVGDLLESLAKRQAQVKDSGALLAQHGGILDRVDGILAALPLASLTYSFVGH